MRCTVVTPESTPLPRLAITSSLSQGMSFARGARRVAGDLADDRAAVHVLPVRTGVVAADGLAVEQQRRDRLAERPGELAVGAGLALVHLRAFGVPGRDRGLARRRDRGGKLGIARRAVTACEQRQSRAR